jgi:hypothetical protein
MTVNATIKDLVASSEATRTEKKEHLKSQSGQVATSKRDGGLALMKATRKESRSVKPADGAEQKVKGFEKKSR